jgi:hypothetical protein
LTARRVLLLGPPLVLAVWETIHPRPDVNAESVMDIATWFMAFHLIQLPLIVLLALSVYLLADSLGQARAWTTLVGLAVFTVFFSAYDAWAGIAAPYAMREARDFSPAEQDAVWDAVEDWPGTDPIALAVSIIGSLGLLLVLIGLARAARRAGTGRAPWILLVLAGAAFVFGHPFPPGTISFGLLFLAALLLEWRRPAAAPHSSPT